MRVVEAWEKVSWFIESGGAVLLAILLLTALMWTLIFERILYMNLSYPRYLKNLEKRWEIYASLRGWKSKQVRHMLISEAKQNLDSWLPMITTLVAVCPLLGLLGTVTGMIEVFDVMAIAGNANPRAMASGVSKATIPTMAGMMAALSGLYMSIQLKRTAEKKHKQVGELFSSNKV